MYLELRSLIPKAIQSGYLCCLNDAMFDALLMVGEGLGPFHLLHPLLRPLIAHLRGKIT